MKLDIRSVIAILVLSWGVSACDDDNSQVAAVSVAPSGFNNRLEFVGVVVSHAAENAQAARLADRGGNVLGRGEPDDRVLDAQPVAQRRAERHGQLPASAAAASFESANLRAQT